MTLLAYFAMEGTEAGLGSPFENQAGRDGVAAHAWGLWTNSPATLPIAAAAKVTAGVAIKFAAGGTGPVLQFKGDARATTHLSLAPNAAGNLVLSRGATVLATSTQTIVYGTNWYYVEMQATISDSGGTCVVRVDEVEWINFSGDTKNAGTASTIDGVTILGNSANRSGFDDFYVTNGTGPAPYDGFLGDVKVSTLLVNGNGAQSNFIGSDGNSIDNYLLVDDPTPSETDYVGSTAVGARDLYAFQDLSTSDDVLAVQPLLHVHKTDAGVLNVKPLVRGSAGTVVAQPAQVPAQTMAAMLGEPVTLNPDGGVPWTVAAVNAAQVGAEVAP